MCNVFPFISCDTQCFYRSNYHSLCLTCLYHTFVSMIEWMNEWMIVRYKIVMIVVIAINVQPPSANYFLNILFHLDWLMMNIYSNIPRRYKFSKAIWKGEKLSIYERIKRQTSMQWLWMLSLIWDRNDNNPSMYLSVFYALKDYLVLVFSLTLNRSIQNKNSIHF